MFHPHTVFSGWLCIGIIFHLLFWHEKVWKLPFAHLIVLAQLRTQFLHFRQLVATAVRLVVDRHEVLHVATARRKLMVGTGRLVVEWRDANPQGMIMRVGDD
jgi:hypothetical protein